MNDIIRWLGIGIDASGLVLLFVGTSLMRVKPFNWHNANKTVRVCWVLGGVLVILGLVIIPFSF